MKEELCRNTRYKRASRPLPHFTRDDETKLATVQKVKPIAPAPVVINVEGDGKKFDAVVVLEGHFQQGLYLGRQELRFNSSGVQDAQGEARIDERAFLVVALAQPSGIYPTVRDGRHRFRSFQFFFERLPKDCLLSCSQPPAIRHTGLPASITLVMLKTSVSSWGPHAENHFHRNRRPFGCRRFPAGPQRFANIQRFGGPNGHEGYHQRPESTTIV